jgi:hypothetical protein
LAVPFFGSATQVMLTIQVRATVGQKHYPLREANGSHGRQGRVPRVWIDTVQEERPYS